MFQAGPPMAAPYADLRRCLVAAAWALAAVPACAREPRIDNALAACVRLQAKPAVLLGNLSYLPLETKTLKPASECGCKSALLHFRATVDVDGAQRELIAGLAMPPASGTWNVPVSSAPLLARDRELRLHIGCAPPD